MTTLKAGFGKQQKSLGSDFGIHYNIGECQTIKANMKDAEFQSLGGNSLGKTLDGIQLLKSVAIKKAVLFPALENAEKQPEPTDWINLIYIYGGQVCSTLIKTYSLSKREAYLQDLRKAAQDTGVEIDSTSVYTCMKITKSKDKNSYGSPIYHVEFFFCKDAKGEPCRYWDFENNCKNKDAVIDAVSDADFENSKGFFEANAGNLFDARIIEEYITNNVSMLADNAEIAYAHKILYAGTKLGYITQDEARKALPLMTIDNNAEKIESEATQLLS